MTNQSITPTGKQITLDELISVLEIFSQKGLGPSHINFHVWNKDLKAYQPKKMFHGYEIDKKGINLYVR